MTTTANVATIIPYNRQGEIDYAGLEFDPDQKNLTPDAMEQNLELSEILGLFRARFTDFGHRPDVFLDNETFICYDPVNLNVRIAPDIYLAFGVDARAIRPRKLYLPWEVGKPPDWALEIASASTAQADIYRKPGIYAAIGVPEFWRFDPTGGRYHGERLSGGLLGNGAYRPVDLTGEPDGILKGYSPVLELSLCWDEGWPRLYDPATGAYLEGWREVWHAREAERNARLAAEARAEAVAIAWEAERNARLAAEAETARLLEQLRRLQSGD